MASTTGHTIPEPGESYEPEAYFMPEQYSTDFLSFDWLGSENLAYGSGEDGTASYGVTAPHMLLDQLNIIGGEGLPFVFENQQTTKPLWAMSGEELIDYIAHVGFAESPTSVTGEETDAINWFKDRFSGTTLGSTLAFDTSVFDTLGELSEIEEEGWWSEYETWLGDDTTGATAITAAEKARLQDTATTTLEEYDISNQEQIAKERESRKELLQQAFATQAGQRRSAARRGLASGKGTNVLTDYMNVFRQGKEAQRLREETYGSDIQRVEDQLTFDLGQQDALLENEMETRLLGISNNIIAEKADYLFQVNTAIDAWYAGLISNVGANLNPADTTYFGADGVQGTDDDIEFNIFGGGGA